MGPGLPLGSRAEQVTLWFQRRQKGDVYEVDQAREAITVRHLYSAPYEKNRVIIPAARESSLNRA